MTLLRGCSLPHNPYLSQFNIRSGRSLSPKVSMVFDVSQIVAIVLLWFSITLGCPIKSANLQPSYLTIGTSDSWPTHFFEKLVYVLSSWLSCCGREYSNTNGGIRTPSSYTWYIYRWEDLNAKKTLIFCFCHIVHVQYHSIFRANSKSGLLGSLWKWNRGIPSHCIAYTHTVCFVPR